VFAVAAITSVPRNAAVGSGGPWGPKGDKSRFIALLEA